MGYYLRIKEHNIRRKEEGIERFDDELPELHRPFTPTKGEAITEKDNGYTFLGVHTYTFKSAPEIFRSDLKKLSRAGFKGYIVLAGEQGEFYKYRLVGDGRVKLYYKEEIDFPEEPEEILK